MTGTATGRAGVASGHPQAALAGRRALDAGGTAVDAALAAAFTQWVVSPPLCGPGGDLVALVADGGSVTSYGGWSRVPLGIDVTAEVVASGPRAAVVPGALRGADAAWRAAGRLPWQDLFAGGLEAAAGHVVTAWMARSYAEVVRRGHGHAIGLVTDRADPPAEGETLTSHRLAATLGAIAADGPDAFYEGELASRIDAAARSDGAWVRAEDLLAVQAAVEPADRTDLGDVTVWLTPWPSQASITAEVLAAVSPSADPAGTAYAERVAPLVEELLVKRCVVGLGGTTVSVAADAEGRSAAVVHSLAATQFGSAWVAGDTGVAFGNRVGTALTLRPDLPAANPRPGAVLPHTLSAGHVRRGDEWCTVATPGGDRQVQWLAQAIQRYRRGADAATMASGPRWFVCPEGDRFGVPAGIGQPWFAFGEPEVEWSGAARCAGYDVRRVASVGGGLQIVCSAGGRLELASDQRLGGSVAVVEDAP